MKLFIRTVFLSLLFVHLIVAGAVRVISLEQGLSQSVVFDVTQDSSGFMWIATQDGLNRFDGYNFKVFRFIPNDTTSLSDNWITTLLVTPHALWIGTHHGGLNRLEWGRETFQRFFAGEKGHPDYSDVWIQDILQDSVGSLWIATWGKGLIRFFPDIDSVRVYSETTGLSNNYVSSLLQVDHHLLVATKCGLNRIDLTTDSLQTFYFEGKKIITTDNFFTCLNYQNGKLWIGSLSGLKQWNPKTREIRSARVTSGQFSFPESGVVTAILSDAKQGMWIGTRGKGLFRIQGGRVVRHLGEQSDENETLSNQYVRCLFQDRAHNVWIGTWGGGVNVLDTTFPLFKGVYGNRAKKLLTNPLVNALLKDRRQRLWVGTGQAGITVLDESGKPLFRLRKNSGTNALSDDRIHALVEDDRGHIWIGTHRGLDEWDGRVIRHKLTGYKKRLLIWKFFKDHFGTIWIGHRFGLIRLFPGSGNYREYSTADGLAGEDITAIFEDYRGHLWVGSRESGLTEMIFENGSGMHNVREFRHFRYKADDVNSLCSNNILSIAAYPDSVLWIGTNQGLNRLSLNTYSVTHYYQAQGLPNDVIYSIVKDNHGMLWLATNRGLSCFDPQSDTFRNFTPDHGLQSYEFNQGAFFKDRKGRIYFGGINGFNYFFPDSIKQNAPQQKIVFTQILADGMPVAPEGVHLLSQINLPYSIHTLSLEFTSFEFLNPDVIKYSCLMRGVDQQWHRLGKRHSITYTNMAPGDYRFSVKATNRQGLWNANITTLSIHIPPPFWKTWWFVLTSVIFFVGIIALFVFYRVRHLLAVERFQRQVAADLHDEIGAGLSEINILSAILETKAPKEISQALKHELAKIGERSRSLMNEMNDIVWLIKPRKDTLRDLFFHLRETFNDVLEAKNMSFTIDFSGDVQNIVLKMEEKHHVYLLFKEALNNAIKYSKARNIRLSIKEEDRKLSIALTDDGIGFDPQSKRSGNGLKNMRHRARQLHGTIQIESAPGRGTRIVFSAKFRKKH